MGYFSLFLFLRLGLWPWQLCWFIPLDFFYSQASASVLVLPLNYFHTLASALGSPSVLIYSNQLYLSPRLNHGVCVHFVFFNYFSCAGPLVLASMYIYFQRKMLLHRGFGHGVCAHLTLSTVLILTPLPSAYLRRHFLKYILIARTFWCYFSANIPTLGPWPRYFFKHF